MKKIFTVILFAGIIGFTTGCVFAHPGPPPHGGGYPPPPPPHHGRMHRPPMPHYYYSYGHYRPGVSIRYDNRYGYGCWNPYPCHGGSFGISVNL